MAGQQRSREAWQQLVAECEQGNLTQQQFATEHGVNVRTLSNWAYRLRRERRGLKPMPKAAPIRFVPVRVRTEKTVAMLQPPAAVGQAIEVCMGNVRLHFVAGIDCDYMGRLLAALSQHCAC